VTTGHQLNLFTGYIFLYKKSSPYVLPRLKAKYPSTTLSLFIGWRRKTMILKKSIILISRKNSDGTRRAPGPVRLSTDYLFLIVCPGTGFKHNAKP
jgi:hypothetical protein